jgi:membrane protein implicated in regulation of membrane protease activity
MDVSVWQIWVILAILLLIAEIFTATFLTACLAIGCLAAGFVSYLDFEINSQIIAFSLGTAVTFFGIRPFMLKYAHRSSNKVKTNIDALVGKVGRVSVTIDNSKSEGRVIVGGDDWKAEAENNEIISSGNKAVILKVNSTILIVKPLN